MSQIVLVAVLSLVDSIAAVSLTLGQDVDWPPYAFEVNGTLEGFGKDIADGLTALCDDVTITVVKVGWAECWASTGGGTLGAAIANGSIDGCMTYTNTQGVRQEHAEFSHGILDTNNAAGLLTLLNSDGTPKVTGSDDLKGKKIVDVGGWAPTADTILNVTNKCTGEKYSADHTMLVPAEDGNDAAMTMLKAGEADAMFVYSNQAKNYQACTAGATDPWDCDLWSGFGTDYAYVQTGQFGYTINGTTLIMGKKGSGKAAAVDACLAQYMETKAYFDVCTKHDLVSSCYRNSHFTGTAPATPIENKPTDEQTGDCSDGYCPCPGSNSTAPAPAPSTNSTAPAPAPSAGVTTSDAHHGAPLLTASVFAGIWSWLA